MFKKWYSDFQLSRPQDHTIKPCPLTIPRWSKAKEGPSFKLSCIDKLADPNSLSWILWFRDPIDDHRLREALSYSLGKFPVLCGRIRSNAEGDYYVNCSDAGIQYQYVAKVDFPKTSVNLPNGKKAPELDCSWLRVYSHQSKSSDLVEEVKPFDKLLDTDEPLMTVKLCHFNVKTAEDDDTDSIPSTSLGISVSHALVDVYSLQMFLSYTADCYNHVRISPVNLERNTALARRASRPLIRPKTEKQKREEEQQKQWEILEEEKEREKERKKEREKERERERALEKEKEKQRELELEKERKKEEEKEKETEKELEREKKLKEENELKDQSEGYEEEKEKKEQTKTETETKAETETETETKTEMDLEMKTETETEEQEPITKDKEKEKENVLETEEKETKEEASEEDMETPKEVEEEKEKKEQMEDERQQEEKDLERTQAENEEVALDNQVKEDEKKEPTTKLIEDKKDMIVNNEKTIHDGCKSGVESSLTESDLDIENNDDDTDDDDFDFNPIRPPFDYVLQPKGLGNSVQNIFNEYTVSTASATFRLSKKFIDRLFMTYESDKEEYLYQKRHERKRLKLEKLEREKTIDFETAMLRAHAHKTRRSRLMSERDLDLENLKRAQSESPNKSNVDKKRHQRSKRHNGRGSINKKVLSSGNLNLSQTINFAEDSDRMIKCNSMGSFEFGTDDTDDSEESDIDDDERLLRQQEQERLENVTEFEVIATYLWNEMSNLRDALAQQVTNVQTEVEVDETSLSSDNSQKMKSASTPASPMPNRLSQLFESSTHSNSKNAETSIMDSIASAFGKDETEKRHDSSNNETNDNKHENKDTELKEEKDNQEDPIEATTMTATTTTTAEAEVTTTTPEATTTTSTTEGHPHPSSHGLFPESIIDLNVSEEKEKINENEKDVDVNNDLLPNGEDKKNGLLGKGTAANIRQDKTRSASQSSKVVTQAVYNGGLMDKGIKEMRLFWMSDLRACKDGLSSSFWGNATLESYLTVPTNEILSEKDFSVCQIVDKINERLSALNSDFVTESVKWLVEAENLEHFPKIKSPMHLYGQKDFFIHNFMDTPMDMFQFGDFNSTIFANVPPSPYPWSCSLFKNRHHSDPNAVDIHLTLPEVAMHVFCIEWADRLISDISDD